MPSTLCPNIRTNWFSAARIHTAIWILWARFRFVLHYVKKFNTSYVYIWVGYGYGHVQRPVAVCSFRKPVTLVSPESAVMCTKRIFKFMSNVRRTETLYWENLLCNLLNPLLSDVIALNCWPSTSWQSSEIRQSSLSSDTKFIKLLLLHYFLLTTSENLMTNMIRLICISLVYDQFFNVSVSLFLSRSLQEKNACTLQLRKITWISWSICIASVPTLMRE